MASDLQGMITRRCTELVCLEQTRHNLRMRWPTGMRLADDEADSKRERIESQIETVRSQIDNMRKLAQTLQGESV